MEGLPNDRRDVVCRKCGAVIGEACRDLPPPGVHVFRVLDSVRAERARQDGS